MTLASMVYLRPIVIRGLALNVPAHELVSKTHMFLVYLVAMFCLEYIILLQHVIHACRITCTAHCVVLPVCQLWHWSFTGMVLNKFLPEVYSIALSTETGVACITICCFVISALY